VWDQTSKGTNHMIRIATKRKLRVLVVSVEGKILENPHEASYA
jgi:hypothetical protein